MKKLIPLVSLLLFACSENTQISIPMTNQTAGKQPLDSQGDKTPLMLSQWLHDFYLGSCLEKIGDEFRRNDGLETCIVFDQKNVTDRKSGMTYCYQRLECRPTDDVVRGPDGTPVPNPVGDHTYIGGAPHICSKLANSYFNLCAASGGGCFENEEQWEKHYGDCISKTDKFHEGCMKNLLKLFPSHYDCDDFSFDYQHQCKTQGIPVWGLGCQTPQGGHAMNIVEQPDGNSSDGQCRYCIAEPQTRPPESPLVACWDQPCGQPTVPDDIQRQRQIWNCYTFKGVDPNAGEPLYSDFPNPNPICRTKSTPSPTPESSGTGSTTTDGTTSSTTGTGGGTTGTTSSTTSTTGYGSTTSTTSTSSTTSGGNWGY